MNKYKEDFESAKKWYKIAIEQNNKLAVEILEKHFPELKESEDERIMKEIVDFINRVYERQALIITDEEKDKWLAWLEKQKSIPAEEYLQGKEDVLWCIKQARKYAKDENEMGTCWFAEKWLENQGELKRNDNCLLSWSEEDEKMLQSLEGIVKDYWAKAEQEKSEIKIREASKVSYFLKTIQKSPLCWIKCSDFLPNKDGTYLVVTDGSHNCVYDMARYDSIEGWHKASEIIYWMPIPQLNNKSIEQGNEPSWCHHKVDLSNCSEEYRKAYYDGWNNCNMQHSQYFSEKNDVFKCLINGFRFFYEGNVDALWGTTKWNMPVKHILEVLKGCVENEPTYKVDN